MNSTNSTTHIVIAQKMCVLVFGILAGNSNMKELGDIYPGSAVVKSIQASASGMKDNNAVLYNMSPHICLF
jgi:hypothetical protein